MNIKGFISTLVFGLLSCSAPDTLAANNDLLTAAKHGDVETVRQLLTSGVAVNTTDAAGWTTLMFAAQGGHEAAVRLLLDAGATMEATTKEDSTALIIAAANGHEAVVALLLGAETNSNTTDQLGRALKTTAQEGHIAVAQLLLSHCAGLKKTYCYQLDATADAYCKRDFAMLQLILQTISKRITREHPSHPLTKKLHIMASTQCAGELIDLFSECNLLAAAAGPPENPYAKTAKRAIKKGKVKQLKLLLDLGVPIRLSLGQLVEQVSTQLFALVLDYYNFQSLKRELPFEPFEYFLVYLTRWQRPEIAQLILTHSNRYLELYRLHASDRKQFLTQLISGIESEATCSKKAQLGNKLLALLHRSAAPKKHHADLLRSLAARGMLKQLAPDQKTRISRVSMNEDNLLTQIESIIDQRKRAVCKQVDEIRDLGQLISEFEGKGL